MRCLLAGQYYAELDSGHAQTYDHVVHSMSSTITMVSIEETSERRALSLKYIKAGSSREGMSSPCNLQRTSIEMKEALTCEL